MLSNEHEREPASAGRRSVVGGAVDGRARDGRAHLGAASGLDRARSDRSAAGSWHVRFDPSEPRDESGRWTSGGTSADEHGEHVQETYKHGGVTFHALTADGNQKFH